MPHVFLKPNVSVGQAGKGSVNNEGNQLIETHLHHCREIIETDWGAIMRIQSEVYYEFAPESEVVMRSKLTQSPATCFVATGSNNLVHAYCLAHPYPPDRVAVLGRVNSERWAPSANLYVHDLAVQQGSTGRGVAQALFHHLTSVALAHGYRTMSLVAVQQAAGFWERMGFLSSTAVTIDESYASGAIFMTRQL
ncbi:GNAT family N-acetyltransferase [Allorhodopirellula heiligendammensis]|uniref:Acetyltransferase (GNAT) family protein n=1 Tax=Allorhodopirellula heiligendammensis TaxID=2714739 RepID=A0A5C6BC70_9BACT|nr:GNAT family N-acetyltransferase [Allorhodopirellula heiligendammensis]TWU09845.1 Acetyltransferase (GNAT) family protein [Allorhodopirellula heiligendammensis]